MKLDDFIFLLKDQTIIHIRMLAEMDGITPDIMVEKLVQREVERRQGFREPLKFPVDR